MMKNKEKFRSSLLQLAKIINREPNKFTIENTYYYYMYCYSLYVEKMITQLVGKYKLIPSTIANSIAYQIVAFAKPNYFNYIILYEYKLLDDNNMLDGSTEEEKMSLYIKTISNTIEWVDYIFDKYPEFLTLLFSFTRNCFNYIQELLNHYTDDYSILKKFNGEGNDRLIDIKMFVGDLHNGKCVSIFIFNNKQILYKPRNARNEKILQQLFIFLNTIGFEYSLQVPRFIDKAVYSWHEYILAEECETKGQIIEYFENFGGVLCVLYLLGSTDIIPDNIITSKGKTYLIDYESITSYNHINGDEIDLFFNESVIHTGVLPVWMINSAEERDRICSSLFHFNDSDNHLPKFEGKSHQLDKTKLDLFVNAFIKAYHFIVNNRQIILDKVKSLPFNQIKNRIIIHPTSIYSLLLNNYIMPESLHGSDLINPLLEVIINADFYEKYGEITTFKESIIEQLKTGNIPLFYVLDGNTELYDASGKIALNHFIQKRQSIRTQIIRRLNNMSEIDCKHQVGIIESTCKLYYSIYDNNKLNENNKKHFAVASNRSIILNTSDERVMLNAALTIADEIIDHLIIKGEMANLICKNRSQVDGRYEISPLNGSLYDGLAGIGIFMYYLGVISQNNLYLDIAHVINRTINHKYYLEFINQNKLVDSNYSPLSWPASTLYCNLIIQGSIDRTIEEHFFKSVGNNIENYEQYDFLSGLCGLIVFMLNNQDITKQHELEFRIAVRRLLDLGITNGNKLFYEYRNYYNSNKYNTIILGGFAHGSSSIAYTLFRLSQFFQSSKLSQLSKMALEHDRSFFSEEIQGWIDGRDREHQYDGSGWCHGSAGIALSRILMSEHGFKDSFFYDEISIAKKNILKELRNNSSICHGDLGNLEVLMSIAHYMNDESLKSFVRSQINHIATQIIKKKKIICGDGSIHELYGLFMGVTGVGYQLLRFYSWKSIPSVLCLEHKPIYEYLHQ